MAQLRELIVSGPARFVGASTFNDDVVLNKGATSYANIIPGEIDAHSLGNSTYRWNGIYGNTVYFGGTTYYINGTAANLPATTIAGLTVAGDLLPSTSVAYNLGSSSKRWLTLYVGNGAEGTAANTGAVQITGGLSTSGKSFMGSDLVITGDIDIQGQNADHFVKFTHTTSSDTGFDWRLGYLGTGNGDANYFVIQSNSTSATWTDVIRLGLTSFDASFAGNINPRTANTGSIGTSTLKWNKIYATTFYGDLDGNAKTATNATNATTASKLAVNAGSATRPIYFASGIPVQCNETLAVNISKNAATATVASKLATARTISIDTGATGTATSFDGSSNITIPITSVKESYLSWGGKNFSGTYGCIDAAMISELGANRLAFGKAAGIIIQYSTDGGNHWSDYGASDSAKIGLFSSGYGFTIGKATKDTITTNCMLRVIIDSDAFGIYTVLNKFVIYLSTNGCSGCYCTIDASLQSSPTTFTTFADRIPVSGWSGYNIINTSGITTYGNSANNQYGLIRFTFGCTGVNTKYSGLIVSKIMGFGGVGWSTPSTMAQTGHLYAYDSSQNAIFPAKITATEFKGSLSGNATTASKLNTNAGEDGKPIYFAGGIPVAFVKTIGSTARPVYVNDGTITACSATIGSTINPVYMNGGTITASNATVGSVSRPIYLNAGAMTAVTAVGTAYGGTGNTTYNENRVVYTESATKISSTNHFASSIKMAINSTTEPKTTFHVEGSANVDGEFSLDSKVKFVYNNTDKCVDIIFI